MNCSSHLLLIPRLLPFTRMFPCLTSWLVRLKTLLRVVPPRQKKKHLQHVVFPPMSHSETAFNGTTVRYGPSVHCPFEIRTAIQPCPRSRAATKTGSNPAFGFTMPSRCNSGNLEHGIALEERMVVKVESINPPSS